MIFINCITTSYAEFKLLANGSAFSPAIFIEIPNNIEAIIKAIILLFDINFEKSFTVIASTVLSKIVLFSSDVVVSASSDDNDSFIALLSSGFTNLNEYLVNMPINKAIIV